MAKQTMKIHADRANVTGSTAHLAAPIVPIKSTLEIAMEKAGMLVDRDKPKAVDTKLVEMYAELERQMLLLRAAIHHDKIQKGLVTVDSDSPLFGTPVVDPQPEPIPIVPKTKFYLDSELLIGQTKPRTTRVKAEALPADDFEPAPKPVAVKAETVTKKRDDHKAGKESFVDTFRDAVMEAFTHTKPGTYIEAHTVPKAETPELAKKFRVFFEIHHLGSKIILKRLSKKSWKAFEAEIPLSNGKLNRELIPAYASKK